MEPGPSAVPDAWLRAQGAMLTRPAVALRLPGGRTPVWVCRPRVDNRESQLGVPRWASPCVFPSGCFGRGGRMSPRSTGVTPAFDLSHLL